MKRNRRKKSPVRSRAGVGGDFALQLHNLWMSLCGLRGLRVEILHHLHCSCFMLIRYNFNWIYVKIKAIVKFKHSRNILWFFNMPDDKYINYF